MGTQIGRCYFCGSSAENLEESFVRVAKTINALANDMTHLGLFDDRFHNGTSCGICIRVVPEKDLHVFRLYKSNWNNTKKISYSPEIVQVLRIEQPWIMVVQILEIK